MNLILLCPHDFKENSTLARLTERRFHHIKNILKASEGDSLTVGIKNGDIGTAIIRHMDQCSLEMDVTLNAKPPSPLAINLIIALPRPKVISRVIQSVASLGIKKIWLIHAARVEKSYWQSPRLDNKNLHHQCILGLEQSRDTLVPSIIQKNRFKPFVEDELPGIIKETTPLVAHPTASHHRIEANNKPITLAIGPEGGFIPYEINKLRDIGFIPFNAGPRILRVETAIPYILGSLHNTYRM